MVGGLQPPPAEEEEASARATGQGVIFVLENAQLEVAQVGKVRLSPGIWPSVRCCRECPACVRGKVLLNSMRCACMLCNCSIQTYHLLNCDDHATYLKKHKKDPALFRPDITHQVSGGA